MSMLKSQVSREVKNFSLGVVIVHGLFRSQLRKSILGLELELAPILSTNYIRLHGFYYD